MYLDILLDHQIFLLHGTGNLSAKYFHKHKQFEIHRNTPYPTIPPTSSNSDMDVESDGHFPILQLPRESLDKVSHYVVVRPKILVAFSRLEEL